MNWRLFLAVETPQETRDRLGAWVRDIRPRTPGWRWVPSNNIHLTLRFFGGTDPGLVPRMRDELRGLARRMIPSELAVAGWGCFPNSRRPRVLWAGLEGDCGTLKTMAEEAESLARRLEFDPEQRGFSPHLTLARAARQGPSPGLPPSMPPGEPHFGPFLVHELILFRSYLEPTGSRYDVIDRFPLEG